MISLVINATLALLLGTCIFYCIRLDKRIRVFQSANALLGETVASLSRQTKDAEEAIRNFREAAAACEAQIAAPLAAARGISGTLEQQIDDAEMVMNKIGRIVGAASPDKETQTMAAPSGPAARRRLGDLPDSRSRSRFAGIG